MTIARKELVRAGHPGVYHCTSRCVRQAHLCGEDHSSGKNYEYRREWIVDRLGVLVEIFALDVLAYAAMNNHLHVVLRAKPDLLASWSDEEVARRWLKLYPPRHGGIEGYPVEYKVTQGDINRIIHDPQRLGVVRERLGDLSWFMKSLDEYIARKANKEDDSTGRFWEGRFRCRRLDDEAAILTCMMYVDLNPVRAELAESLEDSVYTSGFDRLNQQKEATRPIPDLPEAFKPLWKPVPLVNLDGPESPFTRLGERDYLLILDATGRELHKEKPGYIGDDVRPLIESLGLDADEWLRTVALYNSRFGCVAAAIERMREAAKLMGRSWIKGCKSAKNCFCPPCKAQASTP